MRSRVSRRVPPKLVKCGGVHSMMSFVSPNPSWNKWMDLKVRAPPDLRRYGDIRNMNPNLSWNMTLSLLWKSHTPILPPSWPSVTETSRMKNRCGRQVPPQLARYGGKHCVMSFVSPNLSWNIAMDVPLADHPALLAVGHGDFRGQVQSQGVTEVVDVRRHAQHDVLRVPNLSWNRTVSMP